mmetsp:Transcript_3980/g.25064  ORF Transcript_3980/g.25064 Transcript_3980/m.25064 type:complete len:248 (+) Transcript_3980:885-1628(+)
MLEITVKWCTRRVSHATPLLQRPSTILVPARRPFGNATIMHQHQALACLGLVWSGTSCVHVVQQKTSHGEDVSDGLHRRYHVAVQHYPQQDGQNALQLCDHFQGQGRCHSNDQEGGDVGQESQRRHVKKADWVGLQEPQATLFHQSPSLCQQSPKSQKQRAPGGSKHQSFHGAQVVAFEEHLHAHDSSCLAKDGQHEQGGTVRIGMHLARTRQGRTDRDEAHGEVQGIRAFLQLQSHRQHQGRCRCE